MGERCARLAGAEPRAARRSALSRMPPAGVGISGQTTLRLKRFMGSVVLGRMVLRRQAEMSAESFRTSPSVAGKTMADVTQPTIEEYLANMGAAGRRICDIDASEAGAGNISICLDELPRVREVFPLSERIELPLAAPALAGRTLLVTGSGRRLRQIGDDPLAAVG